MRVGIVGCGLIGNKRARALGEDRLVAVADVHPDRARQLAAQHSGCEVAAEWQALVARPDVDAVVVATTNDTLAHVTDAAVRARYGQGGRLGMEREWRGDKKIAGGGEMLDQGVHLIDLSRWFLGDFSDVAGRVARYFWDWQVEDNGFAMLTTDKGQVAWLHASCTEWKNLFSFEVYGRVGKLAIDGLGGSYGVERLAYYKMLPQMGPPQTTIWEYPGEDRSWRLEWAHFADCVSRRRAPEGNLDDALAALRVVQKLYDNSPPN